MPGPFPGSVPHSLSLEAVAHPTGGRWVLLYLSRWLAAPMVMPGGTVVPREKGTPQGSPISPILATLFRPYAFDVWRDREFPGCPFERYAGDIMAHGGSGERARLLRAATAGRPGALGLERHPAKTKIVYGKDANRPGSFEPTSSGLPRLHLPGPSCPRPGRPPHRLLPGHQRQGEEGERPPDQGLAPQPPQGHGPARPRRGDQPSGTGLDQLLRSLLPLRVALPRRAHQ